MPWQIELARMIRIDRSRRQFPRRQQGYQRIELGVQRLRNEDALMLLLLLDGSEEEHLVPDDGAANRTTILLTAERRLRTVRLLREIVLGGELSIALVSEHGPVERIGARFRHQ